MVRPGLSFAALLCFGCGMGPGPAIDQPGPGDEITVQIKNRHFSDATVYALEGGVKRRVGRVTGKTDETFSFHWAPEVLRMVVDFTGGREYLSDAIGVRRGTGDLLLVISVGGQLWIGRTGG